MEPTLKEKPVETHREGTNLETHGASESHAARETAAPTASENETTVRNRGNHGNVNTVSWTNVTIVPPTMEEIRVHLSILVMLIIVSSAAIICHNQLQGVTMQTMELGSHQSTTVKPSVLDRNQANVDSHYREVQEQVLRDHGSDFYRAVQGLVDSEEDRTWWDDCMAPELEQEINNMIRRKNSHYRGIQEQALRDHGSRFYQEIQYLVDSHKEITWWDCLLYTSDAADE